MGLLDLNHYANVLGRGNKERKCILLGVQYLTEHWKYQHGLITPQYIAALTKIKPAASFKLFRVQNNCFYACYEPPLPNYIQESNIRLERDLVIYLAPVKYDFKLYL